MSIVTETVELFTQLGYTLLSEPPDDTFYLSMGGRYMVKDATQTQQAKLFTEFNYQVSVKENSVLLSIDNVPIVRVFVSGPADDITYRLVENDKPGVVEIYWKPATGEWHWFPVKAAHPIVKSERSFYEFASTVLTPEQLWNTVYLNIQVVAGDVFAIFPVSFTATMNPEILDVMASTFWDDGTLKNPKFIAKNPWLSGTQLDKISERVSPEGIFPLLSHKNATQKMGDKAYVSSWWAQLGASTWNEQSYYYALQLLTSQAVTVGQKVEVLHIVKDNTDFCDQVFAANQTDNLAEAGLRAGLSPAILRHFDDVPFNVVVICAFLPDDYPLATQSFLEFFSVEDASLIIDVVERTLCRLGVLGRNQFGVFPASYLHHVLMDMVNVSEGTFTQDDVLFILDGDGHNL